MAVISCIVWNAHNTAFGRKRSAIRAQVVYILHWTMFRVTCLRLSDVSVICRVTYGFSSMSVSQAAQRRTGLPNIGHRTLPKIWVGILYGAYIPGE